MSDFCGPWSETDIITKSHHLAGVSWEAGINWSLSPAKEGRQQAIGWRCARATHSGSTSLYPGLINSIEIPRPPLTVFPIAQVLASYWSIFGATPAVASWLQFYLGNNITTLGLTEEPAYFCCMRQTCWHIPDNHDVGDGKGSGDGDGDDDSYHLLT